MTTRRTHRPGRSYVQRFVDGEGWIQRDPDDEIDESTNPSNGWRVPQAPLPANATPQPTPKLPDAVWALIIDTLAELGRAWKAAGGLQSTHSRSNEPFAPGADAPESPAPPRRKRTRTGGSR